MTINVKLAWIYGICIAFIILNAVFIAFDLLYLPLLPIGLLIVLLALLSPGKLLLITVFMVPLSIFVKDAGYGLGMNLPSEPIIFGLMVLAIFKLFLSGKVTLKELKHPITLAILIELAWMLVTVASSTLPFVSIKFFLARLWFTTVFYFLALQMFRNISYIKNFLWLFSIPLAIAIVYTLVQHYAEGFSQHASYYVMRPFFTDHTIYAAVIALLIPIAFIFMVKGEYLELNLWQRTFAMMLLGIFIVGILYSYTRAAWLSLAAAAGLYFMFIFKIRFLTVALPILFLFILFYSFREDIVYFMAKNKEESSKTDFTRHLKSVYNITTDASNLERVNRWKSAIRMWQAKPVFGFGPGTYAFEYAPYQHSKDITVISTNFGIGGGVHSEYLRALAESGVLGLLTFLVVVITVFYKGVKMIYNSTIPQVKYLALGVTLGLVTYFVHAVLNNYSDMDKVAVPLWGFFAIITALDTYHNKEMKSEK